MAKEKFTLEALTEEDRLKYEIAAEMGLIDKVKEGGWKSITAKESGKIGGIMASRRKNKKKNN